MHILKNLNIVIQNILNLTIWNKIPRLKKKTRIPHYRTQSLKKGNFTLKITLAQIYLIKKGKKNQREKVPEKGPFVLNRCGPSKRHFNSGVDFLSDPI